MMHLVKPAPQNFSRTFLSINYLTPMGEVIKKSIYSDTNGTLVLNGEASKKKTMKTGVTGNVSVLLRPDWDVSLG